MAFTYARKIDALGGIAEGTGEYNAGYHDGYSRAIEAATEIGEDADAMIEELIQSLEAILAPGPCSTLGKVVDQAETLLRRIKARQS